MKPKACTRCRQWKVRCDAEEGSNRSCTRCRSLMADCVFDGAFKRVSKAKRLLELQSEIKHLKQAQPTPSSSTLLVNHAQCNNAEALAHYRTGTPPPIPSSISYSIPPLLDSSQDASAAFPQHSLSAVISQRPPSIGDKIIGDIRLTPGQVAELFRSYRTLQHQYLPFIIAHESSEVIYAKSPLLFWVICAVASSNRLKPLFALHIRSFVADILTSPARSVETVQALLIICMWPFGFPSIADDLSFLYSGLATQLGLQLGLHRPSLTHTHVSGSENPDADVNFEVRLTTWLACFVVNEMQSSFRGVPPSIQTDFNLLSSFGHPKVDPTLQRLCYISRLNTQCCLTIGARAHNITGLLDASSRTDMITLFSEQYTALLKEHLEPLDDIIEVAFLGGRIQLWSFALLDDMPASADLLGIVQQAEKDAVRLIQLCCKGNISMAPYHVCRSITYSAVVLIKILKSPFAKQREVLMDHIDRARQVLGCIVAAEDDITRKAGGILKDLPFLQDRKLTPQIYSRMTASILYDSLRVYAENRQLSLEPPFGEMDLDGFDWDSSFV